MNGNLIAIVPVPSVRNPCTVPKTLCSSVQHNRGYSFSGELPFQLCENKNDLQHGFPQCGAGIELLIERDKSYFVLFEIVIHDRKVNQIPGNTVNLIDQHMRDLPGPDLLHHTFKSRSLSILGRSASVLKDFSIFQVRMEDMLAIILQLLLLKRKTAFVYLVSGRNPDIECFDFFHYSHLLKIGIKNKPMQNSRLVL